MPGGAACGVGGDCSYVLLSWCTVRCEQTHAYAHTRRAAHVRVRTRACFRVRERPGAKFETLRDGSTAVCLRPGQRLKIDLGDLFNGGMPARKARLMKRLEHGGSWGDNGMAGGARGVRATRLDSYVDLPPCTHWLVGAVCRLGCVRLSSCGVSLAVLGIVLCLACGAMTCPCSLVSGRGCSHRRSYTLTVDFKIADELPAGGLILCVSCISQCGC